MNLQISGQLVGMEARNGGWMAVGVQEVGAQYPKKLSTKKPELIQQAQSLMGQMVTAAYNEAEGNSINPHTGTPYINRYLEALALGQVQLAQPMAQPVPQQMPVQAMPMVQTQANTASTYTPVPMTDAREMKIMRQSAAKVSVELLQHLDPEERNLSSLVRISEQLVKYFNQGVPWETAPVQAPVQQPAGMVPAPTMAVPGDPNWQEPGGNDDIPF